MIRYVSVEEVLKLHELILQETGGLAGLRDRGLVESAVAQPQMTFGGQELYETVAEKAAALCFSLVCNHAFADGNKRIGHAAMETFLVLNGWEIKATVDEQEATILKMAAGELERPAFAAWLQRHLQTRT
jgi:death-on-curing protein